MPKVKIRSTAHVLTLPAPAEGRTVYFDQTKGAPSGFCVRVSPTSRAYYVTYRLRGRFVWFKVGEPPLGITKARREGGGRSRPGAAGEDGARPRPARRARGEAAGAGAGSPHVRRPLLRVRGRPRAHAGRENDGRVPALHRRLHPEAPDRPAARGGRDRARPQEQVDGDGGHRARGREQAPRLPLCRVQVGHEARRDPLQPDGRRGPAVEGRRSASASSPTRRSATSGPRPRTRGPP